MYSLIYDPMLISILTKLYNFVCDIINNYIRTIFRKIHTTRVIIASPFALLYKLCVNYRICTYVILKV